MSIYNCRVQLESFKSSACGHILNSLTVVVPALTAGHTNKLACLKDKEIWLGAVHELCHLKGGKGGSKIANTD